tara:strand:+ start:251 stop:502 length:252 start_codon:yes stop_codon:yes gene_type:complete
MLYLSRVQQTNKRTKTNIMTHQELLTQTEDQLSQLSHDQLLEESTQLLNCLLEHTSNNPTELLQSLNTYYNRTLTTPRRLLGQ